MKKIFLFITVFFISSIFANAENINECKTDIYYGNGVWNTPDEAKESKDILEGIIQREIIRYEYDLQKKYGKVRLAYNWGQGNILDVLETYYQLRESGQLDGVGFYAAITALTSFDPKIILGAIATQALMEPFTKDWEQGNVDEMWEQYYNTSFKLGHRVLLVSHSQGNLFANRIHEKITSALYQDYFANFQVASPASEVRSQKGGYVTLYGDPIINPIPGSMDGNAKGSPGHAFVEAYLNQTDPYGQIVKGIKQLLPTLDSEISQWETNEELNLNTCEAKITVTHRFDLSVEMPLQVYPFNASKKLYQVNGEYVKASCSGNNITNNWEEKQENECWRINNQPKEKIVVDTDTVKFYIQYDYTDPNTVDIYGYGGYRANEHYYTNSEFKKLTECDKSSGDMVSAWNVKKNFSPEQNRFSLVVYAGVNRALQCNLREEEKSADDIEYIVMTSVETEIKHDKDPSLIFPDYFETKVEYTAYLR